jgi:hypothetical protein
MNGTMTVSNIGTNDEQVILVAFNCSGQIVTRGLTPGPIIHPGSSVKLTLNYVNGQPLCGPANKGFAFLGFVSFADGTSAPFSGVFS